MQWRADAAGDLAVELADHRRLDHRGLPDEVGLGSVDNYQALAAVLVSAG